MAWRFTAARVRGALDSPRGRKERYEELVDDLCAQHDDVEPSQMLGTPVLKRNGKTVAGFTSGSMVLQAPRPGRQPGRSRSRAPHLFDPSGEGRPIKEWVVVPEAHARGVGAVAHEALKPAG